MTVPGSANPLLLRSAAPAAYQISRSLRFNSSDSAYLSRTPASAGNRQIFTIACWVKRAKLGESQSLFWAGSTSTGAGAFELNFASDDTLYVYTRRTSTVSTVSYTSSVYRDVCAWYHVVLSIDTTQAAFADQVKLWVNGTQVTAWAAANAILQGQSLRVNAASEPHHIGAYQSAGGATTVNLSAYLADYHLVDGQVLTASSFGQFDVNGEWQPKAYTGSYGTNGFRLDFSDNSAATATTLGKDRAGSNNWTPNNLSVTAGAGNDSLVDTPTSYGTDTGAGGEVRGNYATLNPLDKTNQYGSGLGTLSNGNLQMVVPNGVQNTASANIVISGKIYCEFSVSANPAQSYLGVRGARNSDLYVWMVTDFYRNGTTEAAGSSYAAGDIVGIGYDSASQQLTFYKNGVLAITKTIPSNDYVYFVSAVGATITCNFGQRPFAYTAPSGFKALCDTSLPAPTIARPSTVMDVKLWTGNSGTQNITGLAFSPDLAWVKGRTGILNHVLSDTIRGANLKLASNTTGAETGTDNGTISAFNSDGITVAMGTGTYPGYETNLSTYPYVGWFWDAGSSTVTNTAGSIAGTVSVRANPSAGFSVVTYSGGATNATVGHGLNVAPQFIIAKSRGSGVAGARWDVYHASLGRSKYLYLDGTDAAGTDTNHWGTADPTSSVFGLATAGYYNNTGNMVAYCFAPVAGYSSFGSYTGNGSADGPFVYTGFRPSWVMVKNTNDGLTSWWIQDSTRSTFNVGQAKLAANLSDAENTAFPDFDFTSNGFKVRNSGTALNASSQTIIYAAFAESPFQYARAR